MAQGGKMCGLIGIWIFMVLTLFAQQEMGDE
jgi:hypothetical protein